MSIAIFSALQDTRRGVAKIQTTLEGLPTNLETVCRTSTKEAIHEAISELKEEAYQAAGGNGGRARGFRSGEAEKIISQLVDQLAEQERLKDEQEEDLLHDYAPLEPTVPYSAATVPYSAANPPALASNPETSIDPFDDDPFEPSSSSSSIRGYARQRYRRHTTISASDLESSSSSAATDQRNKDTRKREKLPPGSILFLPKDPFTNGDLIDPVLANGQSTGIF